MGEVPRPQRPALARYCRVLARAAHLRTEKGGALDHDAIARIAGLDVRVVTAWRSAMVEAGLVQEWGEAQGRRYRVVAGTAETASPDDGVNGDEVERLVIEAIDRNNTEEVQLAAK